ncbi:hypothetical protein OPV22_024909 [Ensete ventricosum]|uniref:Uncharacterized protein n=1 Tax=Ensete ventricosum TaxID=4639 RepID=A0AAV8P6W3_ENSVE|nr:hypothetical protein OPV22_024909 [Ensete ventricosum]
MFGQPHPHPVPVTSRKAGKGLPPTGCCLSVYRPQGVRPLATTKLSVDFRAAAIPFHRSSNARQHHLVCFAPFILMPPQCAEQTHQKHFPETIIVFLEDMLLEIQHETHTQKTEAILKDM